MHSLLEHTDVTIMYDNEALYCSFNAMEVAILELIWNNWKIMETNS